MRDDECIAFLQWALPRLSLRWPGFRKVRGQVCKRVARRIRELGLSQPDEYRAYLERHEDEWGVLDRLARVTISRFWRDRAVFEALETIVLPELARCGPISAWSMGCASGEEPYSLVLAARSRGVPVSVLATDADPALLDRARRGIYPRGALKELPKAWIERWFVPRGDDLELDPEIRSSVSFTLHDLRGDPPAGPFQIVLCRNALFTYFDEQVQRGVIARLLPVLSSGGALVAGVHERLPEGTPLIAWPGTRAIFRLGWPVTEAA
jgi:chemotaxis protein methyltransferase CheR